MSSPTGLPAWKALTEHKEEMSNVKMATLFDEDSNRAEKLTVSAAGWTLDYSKNRANEKTLSLLNQLLTEVGMHDAIKGMFNGDKINNTENRSVLHTALRASHAQESLMVDDTNVLAEVRSTLKQMEKFVWQLQTGQWRGYSNLPITDVVSIGIGGSYLGPKVVAEALTPYKQSSIDVHFVANIDGSDITEKLRYLDPETTVFIISSKSFGTLETLYNANAARDWFLRNGGPEELVHKHFAAVSSNVEKAVQFGIAEENIFPMWDWVGGRYSLWSAIGLPIAVAIGMENFNAVLDGAYQMDTHFKTAPLEENLPVIMGALGVWYSSFHNAQSHALIPYDHYLRALPAHIQQLDMESNGKANLVDGKAVETDTGPIIWGGAGTNGQHAYHQLLHQGTRLVPVDFIAPLKSHNPVADHHAQLFANCLSQAQALMVGKTLEQAEKELRDAGASEAEIAAVAPHKVIKGNRPSNTLLTEKMTPSTVGALIALYEHRTFVQGTIWGINSFDQWGVELGKVLGTDIYDRLTSDSDNSKLDASTQALINAFKAAQN
ncbi:glucose-6-phosphate isomerase [Marinomonas mediterranea]|jgi:glucose-6-phosphate isomerase (EC 5.3.1.9)|uniref:Glucose-6-phosphate isomerase n=1 Tax=Marinomonas mediterranea (strain ATCC 700492 / JCM 21426 / NBRC 103028 / MMB-1) TaxID=717774 RepID=F2JV66_MARM1|nr:glucose-6-phosphate isomerase [Marinomonas mediterranea]ADZ92824.1 Glucose-6-phosphate isomerase [Marinomonas mediterranea MMB-1]WCN10757.1 glucose-6-phosphate isomerase [Marinomonas mediterranea]WCN18847.1 glucose-6-phosphate isomerase [Marinomonas mediterranea MMB-1]